jgi:hypothetical protein
VTVHLLGNVVVSVLLPVVEFLRSGACSHLVILPLNVGLDDLDSVAPIVNDKLGHGVLSCLGSLHSLEPLVDQLVHVGFLGQAPHLHGSCWRQGRWRRRTSPRCRRRRWRWQRAPCLQSLTQASLLVLDHTSECITKYELEILY